MFEFRDNARGRILHLASEIEDMFDQTIGGRAVTVNDLVLLLDLDEAVTRLAKQIRSVCLDAPAGDLAAARAIGAGPNPANPFKVPEKIAESARMNPYGIEFGPEEMILEPVEHREVQGSRKIAE